MGDLSEHFNSKEFQCHNGAALPDNFKDTIEDTVEFLERLRLVMNTHIAINHEEGWQNIGIHVLSGHRTLKYNRSVGSKDTSRHVTGQAADIAPVGGYNLIAYGDFYKLATFVDKSFRHRAYRLGRYDKSLFVHVDCGYGHGSTRWKGN